MAKKHRTLEAAAAELDRELRSKYDWVQSIGCGMRSGMATIFVYVRHKSRAAILKLAENGWRGFPVVVRYVGRVTM